MEGGKSRRIPSDLPFLVLKFLEFLAFAGVTNSPRRRKRASAENFVWAACVTGIASRLSRIALMIWFFFPFFLFLERKWAFSSFRDAGNDKLAYSPQSLALIQLYNESLLIKVCLRYCVGREGREEGWEGDDLVGRHGFHGDEWRCREKLNIPVPQENENEDDWRSTRLMRLYASFCRAAIRAPGTWKKFRLKSRNCEQLKRSARYGETIK